MTTAQKVQLWPEGSPHNAEDFKPYLELYPPAAGGKPTGAVIVLPGGGYHGRAPHEGQPFAELFAAHGYFGIVAHYRVHPHRFPAPYADAARAVRMVKANAPEWDIDPAHISLMGFSAGGHLASTVAVQPRLHVDAGDDLAKTFDARPGRLILGYPVISMESEHHEGSTLALLGPSPIAEQRRQFSNDQQVNAHTPPTFIFHTAEDEPVPASNALRFATACLKHKVPVELHLFRRGQHGVGLATDRSDLKIWTDLLLAWLKQP